MSQTKWVEVLDNIFRAGVLLQLAIGVETDHICCRKGTDALEKLEQPFLFGLSHISRRHGEGKVDGCVCMMLLVILYGVCI